MDARPELMIRVVQYEVGTTVKGPGGFEWDGLVEE
jgi:hypothetical protein